MCWIGFRLFQRWSIRNFSFIGFLLAADLKLAWIFLSIRMCVLRCSHNKVYDTCQCVQHTETMWAWWKRMAAAAPPKFQMYGSGLFKLIPFFPSNFYHFSDILICHFYCLLCNIKKEIQKVLETKALYGLFSFHSKINACVLLFRKFLK